MNPPIAQLSGEPALLVDGSRQLTWWRFDLVSLSRIPDHMAMRVEYYVPQSSAGSRIPVADRRCLSPVAKVTRREVEEGELRRQRVDRGEGIDQREVPPNVPVSGAASISRIDVTPSVFVNPMEVDDEQSDAVTAMRRARRAYERDVEARRESAAEPLYAVDVAVGGMLYSPPTPPPAPPVREHEPPIQALAQGFAKLYPFSFIEVRSVIRRLQRAGVSDIRARTAEVLSLANQHNQPLDEIVELFVNGLQHGVLHEGVRWVPQSVVAATIEEMQKPAPERTAHKRGVLDPDVMEELKRGDGEPE